MDYTENIIDNSNILPPKATGPAAELRIIDTDFDLLEKEPVVKKEIPVKKKDLINKLNHKNFHNESIRINFVHNRDKCIISFNMIPQPCLGKKLVCLWTEQIDIERLLNTYQFHDISFTDGQNLISAPAVVRGINKRGICFALPETSIQFSSRKVRRFTCENLNIRLIQNGIAFNGSLIDFSPISFRVEIISSSNEPFQWINSKDLISLIVSNQNDPLYSGQCKIIKQTGGPKRKSIILQPLNDTIQRFSPKVYRSKRLTLSPSPDIIFNHPFTNKMVNLKVIDVSGSGLSVEDDEESSVLLPGMIIPSLTLNFANSFYFKCKAQVVYRKSFKIDNQNHMVKCGIAFLDMNPKDHLRLLSLLHQADNNNLYVCNEVDMNELWNFFFESGFIYPKKYSFIYENKEKIKQTFEKLYTSDSSIARHFTWQKKGIILGHLSMLRFYENTWLIHHLAALKSQQQLRIGIEMLKQIGSFTYDSHRLFSSHMTYLMCYFRPENKFPNHFFGGVARNIENPKACSIDVFAYFHYRNIDKFKTNLGDAWKLIKTPYEDLVELENFYDQSAGGLMIRAFDLSPDQEMTQRHELANEYKKINLKRKRLLYSLKYNNTLKAVIQVNISDTSLNLSDLTNCITVFIIDTDNLSTMTILSALSEFSNEYEIKKFPVLLYPHSFAEPQFISYEKLYHLWILDTQHSDDYFKHLEHLF